jgi:hypothetical protein
MELMGIRHALTRIRMEYTELPEMRLTRPQMQRLLNLPSDACEVALAALLHSRFLSVDADGFYGRASSIAARATDRQHLESPSRPLSAV